MIFIYVKKNKNTVISDDYQDCSSSHNLNPNSMKKISLLLLIILFLSFSCQKKNEKEANFDIKKYVELNIEKEEYQGKVYDFVNVKLSENKDSIGSLINKNPRRYEYLLTNRIKVDSVSKAMPDTIKAKAIFNSLIKDENFKRYFYSTFYNKKVINEKFTENELMKIASKFFLSEKIGDKFSTRICIGINGLNSRELKNKDYTLLEAIVYEAIFERLMKENTEEPFFTKNLSKYNDEAISSLKNKNVKDTLSFVREYVFKSMENDESLKTYLLKYINKNRENISIQIEN